MRIILKPGRERALLRRHPWVFSGAISEVHGQPEPGDSVDVVSREGQWLARGAWSPASQIRCRVWTFDADEPIDEDLFRRRLSEALAYRVRLGIPVSGGACGVRLVNAEGDGLPGVIIDRYGKVVVCQFMTVGAEVWKKTLVHIVQELTGATSVYERSDADARSREGLARVSGFLAGDEALEETSIEEDGTRFVVDFRRGHKTGFYLDQRENRRLVREAARGKEVLNCFCYSGGFGLTAMAGGANRVVQIDSSAEALALARRNAELNGFTEAHVHAIEGDVFRELRRMRDSRESFDMIVLDPPKFAETRTQLEGACRGYKDTNLLALKLLRPAGELFTFSCSGAMTPELFRKVIAGAAVDAGKEVAVLRELGQAADHPCMLHIPETCYLNGLHLAVR